MTAWREARRCREEDSDFSEAAELCLTATIWAWRRTEDREDWAESVVELSKGAGAPRPRRVWGEESPMPSLLWWQEQAARYARRAATARRRAASLEGLRRRLRKRRWSLTSVISEL